jgi:hypothetical protein
MTMVHRVRPKSSCNRTMSPSVKGVKGTKGLMIAVIFPVLAQMVIARPMRVAPIVRIMIGFQDPKPAPTPNPSGYGNFGKINTQPIKDQIQRLYQAHKNGKLIIPAGKFKVGVRGSVNPDGTLANYQVNISSGIQEIDKSAMAILQAVSKSRALGPLSRLTSITMVLDVDRNAQLIVTGFTRNEDDAKDLINIADVALFAARFRKANDQDAMLLLNNMKVTRKGTRIDAVISVPKEMAIETLARTMEKK